MRNSLTGAVRFCVLAIGLVVGSQSAQAQGREPFGVWQGERGATVLVINRDGSCSATAPVNAVGQCEWRPNPDRSGGMLTIYYTWIIQPSRVGWNLLWLNRNTLLVNGVERFVRRG
jgi:hypothetical protein